MNLYWSCYYIILHEDVDLPDNNCRSCPFSSQRELGHDYDQITSSLHRYTNTTTLICYNNSIDVMYTETIKVNQDAYSKLEMPRIKA